MCKHTILLYHTHAHTHTYTHTHTHTTTWSTRIYIVSSWKEGNVLFNDALSTFYLRLYSVRHGKNYSDIERGNPLSPHGLLFPISSKGSSICVIPDRIRHTTAFVTPVVEHWLEQEIAQWVHHELPRSYISLLQCIEFIIK